MGGLSTMSKQCRNTSRRLDLALGRILPFIYLELCQILLGIQGSHAART